MNYMNNMKVKILYLLLVPVLLLTANITNAIEIYNKDGNKLELLGKVSGLHYLYSKDSINRDRTYVHIGFKGETQINDQITGYGHWEQQVGNSAPEKEDNSWTRLAFVGVKLGDMNSFDYGRNYGIVHDITSWTNVLPEFGAGTYKADNFMQYRGNGFATYRSNNFFGLVNGLSFAVQYQGKNESVHGESRTRYCDGNLLKNGSGFGASLIYNFGEGFAIGSAISKSKHVIDSYSNNYSTSDKAKTISNNARTYTGGLKYDANNIYLAAQYTRTNNATPVRNSEWAETAKNFEILAQYQFDFGLRPSIAYLQSKGKNISRSNYNYGSRNLVKYVDLSATYFFNKNMSTFVDYKINLLTKNSFTHLFDISTDSIAALGLVYQF